MEQIKFNLMGRSERRLELKKVAGDSVAWVLTNRQLANLELLLYGALSPLNGFMGSKDYNRVLKEMRLDDGTLWPLPIILDITEVVANKLSPGDLLALRDVEGVLYAALKVQDIWQPDIEKEARTLFGENTNLAKEYTRKINPYYVGGVVEGVQFPLHYDFRLLRHNPQEIDQQFQRRGWHNVMAYFTSGYIHRREHALVTRLAHEHQVNLLIQEQVGHEVIDEVKYYAKVSSNRALLSHLPTHSTMFNLVPDFPRRTGLRSALHHAIISRNYGCSHVLIEKAEHFDLEKSSSENTFSKEAKEDLELYKKYGEELGIEIILAPQMVYEAELEEYVYGEEVSENASTRQFFQNKLLEHLDIGRKIPDWYTFPEVVQKMRHSLPQRSKRGFTIFLTGLPSSGKSTIANILLVKLMELGERPVTLLDGDIVRRHLSSELNFSKEHRDINIRRIGFVASEITKNGGIAICAPIAPYSKVRKEVNDIISDRGGFILVHISTPLEVCETRDRKGMYAKARAGIIKSFTGISDPYEIPQNPDVTLNTTGISADSGAQRILLYLEKEGYIGQF